jgi:hypothetical protein
LPVSCAISRAGITTLKAIVVLLEEGELRPPFAQKHFREEETHLSGYKAGVASDGLRRG